MWKWLSSWRRPRTTAPDTWRVVLFTRSGCHLCDDAWTVLETARRRYGFALTKVDIDTNVELTARYGLEIPVVEVNGQVRFRGLVNAVLLQRLFDGSPGSGTQ
jgi:glutaredoxin